MIPVEISIIPKTASVKSVQEISLEENEIENRKKESKSALSCVFEALGISAFGIIGFCLLFSLPWTTVPRTDSIIYQSHWMELLLPLATVPTLVAGILFLELINWTKEEKMKSMWIYLRLFSMQLIPFDILYVSSYLIWSVYLEYNHPFPQLVLLLMFNQVIPVIALWFVLPSHLMAKKDFRKKMKIYSVYLLWLLGTLYLKEFLAYLFIFPPGGFQFLVPFIITACRELDELVRSKFVTKMMGVQDEIATVHSTVVVICGYAPFMSMKGHFML